MSFISGYSIGKQNTDALKTIDILLDKRIKVNPDNHNLEPVTPEQFEQIKALLLVRGLIAIAK